MKKNHSTFHPALWRKALMPISFSLLAFLFLPIMVQAQSFSADSSGVYDIEITATGTLDINAIGADGALVSFSGKQGGSGGDVTGTFNVNTGDFVRVIIGGIGQSSTGDAGGGGATAIINCGNSLSNCNNELGTLLVVAGAGGGANNIDVGGGATNIQGPGGPGVGNSAGQGVTNATQAGCNVPGIFGSDGGVGFGHGGNGQSGRSGGGAGYTGGDSPNSQQLPGDGGSNFIDSTLATGIINNSGVDGGGNSMEGQVTFNGSATLTVVDYRECSVSNPPRFSADSSGIYDLEIATTGTLDLNAIGADGAFAAFAGTAGGSGGDVTGTFNVTAGDFVRVIIGGAGVSSSNDAGGGGGTAIINCGNSLTNCDNELGTLMMIGGAGGGAVNGNVGGGATNIQGPGGPGTGNHAGQGVTDASQAGCNIPAPIGSDGGVGFGHGGTGVGSSSGGGAGYTGGDGPTNQQLPGDGGSNFIDSILATNIVNNNGTDGGSSQADGEVTFSGEATFNFLNYSICYPPPIPNPFITTWKTDNPGISGGTEITIPIFPGETYNYDVDWDNDGVYDDMGITGDITHDFGAAGTYTIRIQGDFPRIYFNDGGDKDKLTDISQWGDIAWTSMEGAFYGCSNLNMSATDVPDLSGVSNMREMFEGATSFNGDLSSWDVSSVTDMNSMFSGATVFDQSLGNWTLNASVDLSNMLNNCGMSRDNYDATLIGWDNNPSTPSGRTLGALNLIYCDGETARNNLIADGWIITGDVKDCSFNPFITTWKTDNPGTSGDTEITIPTFPGETYNYDVDWDNDGTYDTIGITGDLNLDFGAAGNYTIAIRGDFPKIFFNDSGDKEKILSIDQWGDIEWSGMDTAFYGCTNLVVTATDVPDLSNVTDMSWMFVGVDSLSGDFSGWDVSNVTNMVGLFSGCSQFTSDLSGWDVSNVTNMSGMFARDTTFNSNLNNWDVSNVTDMSWMFYQCYQFNSDLNNWDVSNVTDMTLMFCSDISLVYHPFLEVEVNERMTFNGDISNWDVSNVTTMSLMFLSNTSFNRDLSNWDVSKVRSAFGMFKLATSFDQNLGAWDLDSIGLPYTYLGRLISEPDLSLTWMFDQSGMSTASYDATLIGWSGNSQATKELQLGPFGLTYCDGEAARNSLLANGWTFYGDAKDPTCPSACGCDPNLNPLIPNTAAGLHTADIKCDDGTMTHYCDNVGRLLLSISSAEAASIDPADVQVNIVPGTRYYKENCVDSPGEEQGSCFIENEDGAVVFCRTWDVTSAETDATVHYYFDDNDFEIIQDGHTSIGLTPPAQPRNLWLYKVTSAGAGHEKPEDLNDTEVILIHNDGTDTPSNTNWVLGNTGTDSYYAEYTVANFSGGGGGGGQGGSSPVCPVIDATISGSTILATPGTTDVFVNITGGTGPYSVELSDGTTINNYNSGDPITVTANEATAYEIVSVVDANDCPHTTAMGVGAVYIDSGDNTPPVANCDDVTVNLNAGGMATIVVEQVGLSSLFFNDDIATMVLDQTTFDCSSNGSDVVTLTVTDDSGNSDDCTAIITINDPNNVCCPAVRDVSVIPGSESKLYEADQQVTSDAEVKLGDGSTNVIFEAGDNVQLDSGFKVEQGAVFEAKIGPCGSN